MHIGRSKFLLISVICFLVLILAPKVVNAQAPDPDLNNDGIVTMADISLVGSCFGQTAPFTPPCDVADTDGDGDVDFDDLRFVIASFGQDGFPIGGEEDTTPPVVAITDPSNLSLFNTGPITVSGTVDDENATVVVNGVPANFSSLTWTSAVPIEEGNNTITAVAEDAAGNVATASIQVTLDTVSPRVFINSPPDGFVTSSPTVTVAGLINDIVVGTVNGEQAQVIVNGIAAQVSNRCFLVSEVPLTPGSNTITAIGTDRVGNTDTDSITVIFEEIIAESHISLISGNNQTGPIGNQLPEPLVVTLMDGAGNPVPGETVIFKVMENNGALSNSPDDVRSLVATTDAQGRAQVNWTLGTRAGAGNNKVDATAVGFAGTAIFTATALPATTPDKINVDAGNNQTGVAGQPLPSPFATVVTDAGHNRLANVPVTFTVIEGEGNFNGQPTLTVNTNSDGRALAVLTLGSQEGFDNNVVEATFPGNPGFPATFVASGKAAGDPAATKISGVVMDNSNIPLPGVTMRIEGTNLSTQTDGQGQFILQPAPVGNVELIADGSTVERPGTWPSLAFDMVTISGQDNTIGKPIFLLPLDLPNALFVDETNGGTLTLPQVPGFSLTIEAGSATFPDAGKSGQVSVTLVHSDKIPMVPNFGQQPRFIVTIQPAGVLFDPPAPITIPNVDGLALGEVTEMYSFDHDLGQFVAIGTGSVSEDGTVVESDPGVGIIKGGWHCGGNPQQSGNSGSLEVSLSPKLQVAEVGETVTVIANGKPPLDAKYINWMVDDPDVATFVTMPECPDQSSCTAQLKGDKGGVVMVKVTFICTTTGQSVTASPVEVRFIELNKTITIDGMAVEELADAVFAIDEEICVNTDAVGVEGGQVTITVMQGGMEIASGTVTEGTDFCFTPMEGGEVTITATFDPGTGSTIADTWMIIVAEVDLDIDANNDGTITDDDDPLEDPPPGDAAVSPYVGVNNDDDNDDLIQDRFTANVIDNANDADDMILLKLSVNPSDLQNGSVLLKALSDADKVRVFDVTNGIAGAPVVALAGNGTTFQVADLPRTLRLEGILPSSSKRDIQLEATLIVDGTDVSQDTVSVTTAEVDAIIDQNQDRNLVPDRNNSVDFVTLMRKNDRIQNADDLETHERRNGFFIQVEDTTRTAGEVELIIRSFDRTGTEIDTLGTGFFAFGGFNVSRKATGLYQSGICWVVLESDLDNNSATLLGVPGGTIRIEYNDDGRVPRTIIREIFIVDISVQGSSTNPPFSDTPAVPVVFENNEVDGAPNIAADLAAFNNDQRWRFEIFDPRNPAQADITLETKQGNTNTQRDFVTQPGAPAGQYRLTRVSANMFRGNDVWVVQSAVLGLQNLAINDAANNITLSTLPSANDRVRATYVITPVGGVGQPGGPINTTCIRDVAVVSVDFDGVQGLNMAAVVNTAGSVNLTGVAGPETVGFGFDERARMLGGGPVQATLTVSSTEIFFDPIDDDNQSQVNVLPATATIQYDFANDTPADVSPTSHTGSRQINIDGDNRGDTRLHARLNDENGMITATLGTRVVDPTGTVDVGVFIVDTQTPAGAPFNANTRQANVNGLMDIVNDIWAQNAVRFEVVRTEVINAGGDVDAAPMGNFPGLEDTDLNGDGILQTVPTMHIINLGERQTLQQIARQRMTAAGENPNAILLLFVNRLVIGVTNPQGLTTFNAQRVMVANNGPNTRANVAAHEIGHALNITGDFGGVADNPGTDMDETRQTELMHTTAAPDPRDLETNDAIRGLTRAVTYPQ